MYFKFLQEDYVTQLGTSWLDLSNSWNCKLVFGLTFFKNFFYYYWFKYREAAHWIGSHAWLLTVLHACEFCVGVQQQIVFSCY